MEEPGTDRPAEPERADARPSVDRDREAYLDALFRQLDEDPPRLAPRRTTGRVLLGTGFVLIVVGFLAMLGIPAPEPVLFAVLGINVLAVLLVAAGIVLLPEAPTVPPGPPAAGGRGGFRLRRLRSPLPPPHLRIRHARH